MFCFTTMKNKFLKIRLVDKCLILVMAILMAQSAYTLFISAETAAETNPIDIVLRTSMAAIFGYFVSANFTRVYPPEQLTLHHTYTPQPPVQLSEPPPVFYEAAPPPPATASIVSTPTKEPPVPQLQVLIVTIVGITALVTLLVYRNFFTSHPAATAALSQLRDFVSGCVGFLIGCGREDAPEDTPK